MLGSAGPCRNLGLWSTPVLRGAERAPSPIGIYQAIGLGLGQVFHDGAADERGMTSADTDGRYRAHI
jgi:hypothetical protein